MLDDTSVTSESKDSAGLNDNGGHFPFSLPLVSFTFSISFALILLFWGTVSVAFGSFFGHPESGVLLELVNFLELGSTK